MRLELGSQPEGNRPTRPWGGNVGHRVEIVAVGQVGDAEVDVEVFVQLVTAVYVPSQR